jgi:hypothetical protein
VGVGEIGQALAGSAREVDGEHLRPILARETADLDGVERRAVSAEGDRIRPV